MGSADLTGPRAKLGRAEEHIRVIHSELEALTQEHAESRPVTFRREGPWYIVCFGPPPPLPLRLALIIGDCLNNIRAALDHIVWQLVLREDQKPCHTHSFPLCETRKKFLDEVESPPKKRQKRSSLYGIPPKRDAWTIIEQTQPFQRSDPQQHPLLWVAQLNNIDKHRTLLTQQSVVDTEALMKSVVWEPNLQPIDRVLSAPFLSAEHPTEIARLLFAEGTDLRMYMERHFIVEPTVGDGETYISLSILRLACRCVQEVLDQVAALPHVQG